MQDGKIPKDAFSWIGCEDCEYSLCCKGVNELIDLHERLAGSCTWSENPVMSDHWIRSCDESKVLGKEQYCASCGKSVKVKNTK